MSQLQLITAFLLQANTAQEQNIALLDSSILIPAICAIVLLVMIAGIVVAGQKHKRY